MLVKGPLICANGKLLLFFRKNYVVLITQISATFQFIIKFIQRFHFKINMFYIIWNCKNTSSSAHGLFYGQSIWYHQLQIKTISKSAVSSKSNIYRNIYHDEVKIKNMRTMDHILSSDCRWVCFFNDSWPYLCECSSDSWSTIDTLQREFTKATYYWPFVSIARGFPSQRASNIEKVSRFWRHRATN